MKTLYTLILLLTCGFAIAQPCITNTHSGAFTGSSYVSIVSSNNLLMDTTLTVEAWVRASSFGSTNFTNTIFCKHSWSQGEKGFVLRAGGPGQVNFSFAGLDTLQNPTSWVGATSPAAALVVNTWAHVAGVFDGDTIRVFVNGIQVGSTPFKGTLVPHSTFNPVIGKLSDPGQANSRFWSGNLDEIRVWNRALTKSEIMARKNTHIDPLVQTGLVAYYRFNEGTGTTLNDVSGSSNNGTTTGMSFNTLVPFNQTATTPIIFANANTLTSTAAVGYQWNLNGSPIAGATNQSHVVTQNGNYTVTVTDSAGCTATSSVYWVTNVGMNELQQSTFVGFHQLENSVFLNELFTNNIEKLIIYNLNGQVLMEQNINSNSLVIPTNDFVKGMYIIQLFGVSTTFKNKFVIK